MAPRSYALLSELKIDSANDDSNKKDKKIKVRISRVCDVHNPSSQKEKKELLHIAMVLLDEEGQYTYAYIPSYICDRFRPKIIDGKIHVIKRFEVVPNRDQYRVVSDSKIMIKFLYNTYVKATENDDPKIPKHRFDFINLHNIDSRRNNHYTLTDLFGVVVKEIEKANYFAIEIEDESGKRERVTLWDQCQAVYREQKQKHNERQDVIVVVVTSLLVKDYNGYNSISTSSSSSLYINLDIPEVNELKEIWSGKKGILDIDNVTNQITKKDIKSILEHCNTNYKEDLICYCIAKVKDVIAEKPWYYQSCMTCTTRPQFKRSEYFCSKCDKMVELQTIRYRIELKVEDNHCSTIFVDH